MELRAFTVHQPYAYGLVTGTKGRPPDAEPAERVVENRGWRTPHRGVVLVHAGRGGDFVVPAGDPRYPRGVIVGAVLLESVHDVDHSVHDGNERWCCELPGALWDADVIYHWVCRPLARFEHPVEHRGALQLWTPSRNAMNAIAEQLAQGVTTSRP